ncbi:MAG: molybdopterin dinucleotide binding domain-containing protein, partial [Candidatus Puniceispirillaceae bacterium]
PDEVPDEEYPLILSTGRLLEHWHTGSMTRRSEALDQIEPVAEIHLSRDDIDSYQLETGKMVTIETRRGEIEVAVRIDPNLPKGMMFMPFCFSEAPANMLTNPALDPFGKIPELKFSAARIREKSPA